MRIVTVKLISFRVSELYCIMRGVLLALPLTLKSRICRCSCFCASFHSKHHLERGAFESVFVVIKPCIEQGACGVQKGRDWLGYLTLKRFCVSMQDA